MKVSNETRSRIVEAYENGQSKKSISEMFSVNISTVYSIIKTFLNEDRINVKNEGRGRKRALDEDKIIFIKSLIDTNAGITLNGIKKEIFEKYDLNISKSTIDTYITEFNYSLKRISLQPIRRNSLDTLNEREVYARNFLDLLAIHDESDFVFIDEVSFNVTMRTRRGRSLKGTRAINVVPGLRSKNISVCCAMSKDGIIKYLKKGTAFNTVSFVEFCKDLVSILSQNIGKKYVFIMDNVPFHRNEIVKQVILEKGFKISYLPPYSPFLNPIENMFAQWKQYIRRMQPINESVLFEYIDNVNLVVSSNDCNSYFRHMISFIGRCMQKVAIEDE
jgi:transposase